MRRFGWFVFYYCPNRLVRSLWSTSRRGFLMHPFHSWTLISLTNYINNTWMLRNNITMAASLMNWLRQMAAHYIISNYTLVCGNINILTVKACINHVKGVCLVIFLLTWVSVAYKWDGLMNILCCDTFGGKHPFKVIIVDLLAPFDYFIIFFRPQPVFSVK